MGDLTQIMDAIARGDRQAAGQILPQVYDELRRIAARQLRRERVNHTLQPTALVHEVYLRLIGQRQVNWQDRAHFLGVAAQTMRRILVDHARHHGARKRGDGVQCVSIDDAPELAVSQEVPLLELDQALGRLEAVDPELARIVELRASLLRRPDVFVRTMTENLMVYALGRGLTAADMPTVRAVMREAQPGGKVRTERVGDWLVEHGPVGVLDNAPPTQALVGQLGLTLRPSSDANRRRFLFLDGQLRGVRLVAQVLDRIVFLILAVEGGAPHLVG